MVVAKASTTDNSEEYLSLGNAAEGNFTGEDDESNPNPNNNESLSEDFRPKFISYEALKANTIPCSLRGRSYYDCRMKTTVNPYRRGCSAITHCRRLTD
ncbi:protein RALF-like 4 [Neltuma alba]|uniref:protein RALF-like 4 n=1 Tax=Neltuma alba TaxID=207710 RepID=UPI0010A40E8E|nr:protein RALF-like 4 [Prosopis alba]